jgi:hypothetical protein
MVQRNRFVADAWYKNGHPDRVTSTPVGGAETMRRESSLAPNQ